MVTRRTYFIIAVVMFVMFFLFQFSGIALESWNDYETNPYAEGTEQLLEQTTAYVPKSGVQSGAAGTAAASKDTVLYIGDEASPMNKTVWTWAAYTKRNLETCTSPTQYMGLHPQSSSGQKSTGLEMAIIDPAGIDWEKKAETRSLRQMVDSGTDIVFTSLPENSVLENNKELKELLGIRRIQREQTTVTGVHLYQGFLLGGEVIYKAADAKEERRKQDMDLTFPWYNLASGTKAYMRGIPTDKSVKTEHFPPVIWKKSFGTGAVFAVNGSYMEDVTALGILSAMAAETGTYEIYPVVNAQNLVAANYPGMASENESEMMRRYSQSMKNVFQDIIWPNLIAVYQQNNLGLSCMLTPQFDYGDSNLPSQKRMTYYIKLLNEQKAEAGLSGISVSDTQITEKLKQDQHFMMQGLSGYRFTSFYAGDLPDSQIKQALDADILEKARTVIRKYDGDNEILGYETNRATRQTTLADGLKYTYRQDLRTRSIETALGYSSVLADVMQAAYPQDRSDKTWKDLAKYLAADLDSSWKPFQAFSATTVSKCDDRIRSFLALDYTREQKGNQIHLKLNQKRTVWFLLRTNKKPVDIQGGSWKKVEYGSYLIQADEKDVTITLEPVNTNTYIYE